VSTWALRPSVARARIGDSSAEGRGAFDARQHKDGAEACFRAALDVARAQEAKWWELRTSVSLARLLRDTNRCDEARTMLADIYNWFTEGFDLPDLKDAKVTR
jgi:hypothetical protein